MDERALIHAAQKGDLEAFNQLVLEYQDLVYNHACWLTADPDMAGDIVQDSFLKAFQHLSSFRGESLRSWLLRIVTNTCYDELRRGKRYRTQPLEKTGPDGEEIESPAWLVDPSVSIERSVEQAELIDALRQHLEALPERYRSVLVLVDLLDFDYAEASISLNVPLGTVKSRLARGRFFLSQSLPGSKDFLPPSLGKPITKESIPYE